jgi:hypothetical protein
LIGPQSTRSKPSNTHCRNHRERIRKHRSSRLDRLVDYLLFPNPQSAIMPWSTAPRPLLIVISGRWEGLIEEDTERFLDSILLNPQLQRSVKSPLFIHVRFAPEPQPPLTSHVSQFSDTYLLSSSVSSLPIGIWGLRNRGEVRGEGQNGKELADCAHWSSILFVIREDTTSQQRFRCCCSIPVPFLHLYSS